MNTTAPQGDRADDLTALLAEAPDPGDHDAVRAFLKKACDLDLSQLLIRPGTKLPFDGRSRAQRRAKAPAGVYLATADHKVLDGHLSAYIKQFGADCEVNLAVAVGASELVVVDCDTREELAAFLSDAGLDPHTAPTVRSPGQRNSDGVMVHSDGGHFWFTVPDEVDLPEGASYTDPDGRYAVMFGSKYVLIPPSVRSEGPYTVAGEVSELPDWLRDQIIDRAPAQPRVADRSTALVDTPITAWDLSVPWFEVLEPLGWTPTNLIDNCGDCSIWTAPGAHASPKSATAHEPGCTRYRSPNPPLHIWTDNPGEPFDERKTMSKLQVVALADFDNGVGDAMDALGLIPDPVTLGGGDGESLSAHLPDAFWDADPVFEHIRQAAHLGVNSAPAVIGAVLARISAHLDPAVKVHTGIKSAMPLNMFVGLVGSAGTGKSSAYAAACDLLKIVLPDPNTNFRASEIPRELPVGTGPGVAEAYMGDVVDDPLNPKKRRRDQVHHKLLMHSDEGASLVAGIIDNKRGQDIGPTLRLAWSGSLLGQANASSERKREVRDYTLGLVVNFQLEALAAMSTPEQLEYGTPQRFVYFSATDPTIPDQAPSDPGQLTVKLPMKELHYCDELKVQVRQEAVRRARGMPGGGDDDPMEVHRPAMRARLAALLVIMRDPERTVIYLDDVALADMILDASRRLHDTAIDWRRERESAEHERQTKARIREQVAAAVAVGDRENEMAKMETRLLGYLPTQSGSSVPWTGRDGLRKKKFNNDDRPLADATLRRLDGKKIDFDGDTIIVR